MKLYYQLSHIYHILLKWHDHGNSFKKETNHTELQRLCDEKDRVISKQEGIEKMTKDGEKLEEGTSAYLRQGQRALNGVFRYCAQDGQ